MTTPKGMTPIRSQRFFIALLPYHSNAQIKEIGIFVFT
jgi:hypothetical protein